MGSPTYVGESDEKVCRRPSGAEMLLLQKHGRDGKTFFSWSARKSQYCEIRWLLRWLLGQACLGQRRARWLVIESCFHLFSEKENHKIL